MFGSNGFSHICMPIGLVTESLAIACLYHSPANAQQQNHRASVSIELVGDDGLTQMLSDALNRKVINNRNLNLTNKENSKLFIISSETNVKWDILSGKTVLIYHVLLKKDGSILGDKVGVCFEKQVNKCASDIIGNFAGIVLLSE